MCGGGHALNSARRPPPLLSGDNSPIERRTMSTPEIDKDELAGILKRNGHDLTPTRSRPSARRSDLRRMIERVTAPLSREAEPALTFDVEQGQ